MKLEEEVVEPALPSRSAGKAKNEKKTKKHNHIGPNKHAFSAGLAFCPVCDAEKIVRMTEQEKFIYWAAKDAEKAARDARRG